MSLVRCPDCGVEGSSHEDTCRECGRPICLHLRDSFMGIDAAALVNPIIDEIASEQINKILTENAEAIAKFTPQQKEAIQQLIDSIKNG